jgi:hypothetical protein
MDWRGGLCPTFCCLIDDTYSQRQCLPDINLCPAAEEQFTGDQKIGIAVGVTFFIIMLMFGILFGALRKHNNKDVHIEYNIESATQISDMKILKVLK